VENKTLHRTGGWTTFILTLPASALGYAWFAVCLGLFLAERPQHVDYGIVRAQWRPWFARLWRFSTTIGRAMIFHPGHLDHEGLEAHEQVHIRQFEDAALMGMLIMVGIVWVDPSAYWAALAMWALSPVIKVMHFVGAMLRGEGRAASREARGFGKPIAWFMGVYRGSEHERSAYAQTDPRGPNGESWLDLNA
jgi:hypothetical protein